MRLTYVLGICSSYCFILVVYCDTRVVGVLRLPTHVGNGPFGLDPTLFFPVSWRLGSEQDYPPIEFEFNDSGGSKEGIQRADRYECSGRTGQTSWVKQTAFRVITAPTPPAQVALFNLLEHDQAARPKERRSVGPIVGEEITGEDYCCKG